MMINKSILIAITLTISSIYMVLQYLFIPSSIDRIISFIIWCIALILVYLTYFLYFCSNCRGLKIISLPRLSQLYRILEKFLIFSIELLAIGFFMENIFTRILGRNITMILVSSALIFIIWFSMQKSLSKSIRLLIEVILVIITYISTPSLIHELKGLEEQFKLIEVIFNAIG